MEAAEPVGAPTLIQNLISAMASAEKLGCFLGHHGFLGVCHQLVEQTATGISRNNGLTSLAASE